MSSTSAVSTRSARCSLLLLDPASVEEEACEIPAARRRGGGDGGVFPRTGLRQAAFVGERGGGAARAGVAARVFGNPPYAAPLTYI